MNLACSVVFAIPRFSFSRNNKTEFAIIFLIETCISTGELLGEYG